MSDATALDQGQYSLNEIRKYEAVYGRNFISPGGEITARDILSLAAWTPNMHVLDIGCGLGGAAFIMAQTYGARVHGIDLSHNMLQIAQARCQEAQLTQAISFEQADVLRYECRSGFDLVHSRDVFLHIHNKAGLFDAISGCSDMLTRFGGHKYAAGLTIEADRLPAFREAFERIAMQRLSPEDLIPRCKVDAVVTPRELDERAVEALQKLGPFGQGNPEPVLALRRQVARPRVLTPKTGYGSAHLKLALLDAPDMDAIGFGMGDRLSVVEGPVDLAFQVGMDTFRGQRRVSLRLKDLRSAA